MRITPIYSNYSYYHMPQRKNSVSFQGSMPKKIQSEKIFEMEEALRPVWFNQEKFLAKLKEFAHIDINSRNSSGDTLITDSARKGGDFLSSLIYMEKRGEVEGIDWNATDWNGDNILMIALKSKMHCPSLWHFVDSIQSLIERGRFDVNYVNAREGYSLIDCALRNYASELDAILELKGLDVTKTCKSHSIIKRAIDLALFTSTFKKLICHPSIDMSTIDVRDLFQYIDQAPGEWAIRGNYSYDGVYGLSDYQKKDYKKAIEIAVRMSNVRKTQKYYQENGMLTLEQIQNHIKNADCQEAVNMSLNDIGENIGHFLAEIYIDSNDKAGAEQVKNIIEQLRKNDFYFWKVDDIGRTPLMIALEAENLVVAKAMMEKMVDSEFKYFDRGWSCICRSIPSSG